MAKQTIRRTPAASTPKKDYDAGIREQLAPYGLELNDIVAVLEEDPELMKYVTQGAKGESLAKVGRRKQESMGNCAAGAKKTTRLSKATSIASGNGNDIQLGAQATGDYFSLTYHTAETPDTLAHAPNGAMISWENQDAPANRKSPVRGRKPGGFAFGHVTFKTGEDKYFSDHPETRDGDINLVFHKGRNNGPRYGSLSYVTFPKDVTFSPELIDLALLKKRERECDRRITDSEMPKKPQNFETFFQKNPRIGYLTLKQVNPDVPFDLTADGGQKLLQYYNNLPANSPERAALNLLASKNITNPMDYTAVHTAVQEVSDEVLRLRNPEAYAKRQLADTKDISRVYMATPTYIYQLQRALNGDAKRMTSKEYETYIANLDKKSAEYLAISELAKKNLKVETNPVEVKLAIANIAKDHRQVKKEEIDSLFENTPALVYQVQKEFGTQKAGGIRVTSELHEYYNNLPEGSPERKAIDELAMAHIEVSEAKLPKLDAAVQEMAHHYNPNREVEPRPAVHLHTSQPNIKPDVVKSNQSQKMEERAALRDGFKKMNHEQWDKLVESYMKLGLDRNGLGETMKQQAADAQERLEMVLKNLFKDNGYISSKDSMRKGAELLDKYMKLDPRENKSLEGFISFMDGKDVEERAQKKDNDKSVVNPQKDNDKSVVNPLWLQMKRKRAGANR